MTTTPRPPRWEPDQFVGCSFFALVVFGALMYIAAGAR